VRTKTLLYPPAGKGSRESNSLFSLVWLGAKTRQTRTTTFRRHAMLVTVEPEVESGNNKGGEDLYLVFRAVHEGEVPPVTEEIEVALAKDDDYDGVSVEMLGLDEMQPGDPGDTAEPCAVGVSVRYCSNHYEFEWTGDGADVLKLHTDYKDGRWQTVEEYLRNPNNWVFCHRPGEKPKLKCCGCSLVDGNAD